MTGRGPLRRRFALGCSAIWGEEDEDDADDDQAGRSYGLEGRRVVQLPRAAGPETGQNWKQSEYFKWKKIFCT